MFVQSCVHTIKVFIIFMLGIMINLNADAALHGASFKAKTVENALKSLFNHTDLIASDLISIKMPELAENGAVVPISVSTTLKNVESITIFAENNIYPLAANFTSLDDTLSTVSTRLKIAEKTYVIAVVKVGDKLYSARKYIRVTTGGCGGGGWSNYSQSNYSSQNNYSVRPATNEKYATYTPNAVQIASENPVSTFSIDVDTASYSNVRRFVNYGQTPPVDSVRIEEMINYFSYTYPNNNKSNHPFKLVTEISDNPWNSNNHLLYIGIKASDDNDHEIPPSNLVFLIDVSGSMNSLNKLGLLKAGMKMLAEKLTVKDKVAIVVYAGASGVVLQTVAGNEKARIDAALNSLGAGGSTNGAAGIQLAYQLARESFIDGGINRVILGTDGDFNVGVSNTRDLLKLIETERKSGISLTTLGFGMGNYNDHLMEQLADKGNGNYAYIDSANEAHKVLVTERNSTLNTVANDVKIQIEFNPDEVAEYRLIGYENRILKREDFKNDKIDAGDVGAGHSITALYEVTLNDSKARVIDELRYKQGKTEYGNNNERKGEMAFIKFRYKKPNGDTSIEMSKAINFHDIYRPLATSSDNYRFASAVAAWGQHLTSNKYIGNFGIKAIETLGKSAMGDDPFGYRAEFIRLLNLSRSL